MIQPALVFGIIVATLLYYFLNRELNTIKALEQRGGWRKLVAYFRKWISLAILLHAEKVMLLVILFTVALAPTQAMFVAVKMACVWLSIHLLRKKHNIAG